MRKQFRLIPFLILVIALVCGRSAQAQEKTDVIIVGGGLSGLTAAYELQKAGLSYRVLEREARVGGRVQTFSYSEGLLDEAGLAEFWESNPALEIIRDLKLETTVSEASMSSIILDGKIQPFIQDTQTEYLASMLNPAEMKAWQQWENTLKSLIKKIHARQFDDKLWALKEISFAEWVQKQGLSKKAQEIVRIHIEPEIGTGWDMISALDGIAEWHIFLGNGEKPYHVVGGNLKLPQALADRIGREHIHLNNQVTHIQRSPQGVEVRTRNLSTLEHHTYQARYVICAIPLYRLFEIQFQPPLSEKKMEAIYTQGYGAYFTAHVLLDAEAQKYWMIDGVSTLATLTDGPLGVIYGRSSSHEEPKEQKYHMLDLLVTGDYAEQYNARTGSLDPVRQEMVDAMEKRWPGISKYIRQWEFHRYHPRAIAAWPVGRSRFDALSDAIREPENGLYLAGDFTESSHSDGAVISARRVVKDILRDLKK